MLFPINLISFLRNFYWFIGYEYLLSNDKSLLVQYSKLNYFGINSVKFFNFRLIFLFFIAYFFFIGVDEEIVLAFLISVFGYYFYKFIFSSLITFLEFEVISVKNLLLNSFSLYDNFLLNLMVLLNSFKVFSDLLHKVFISSYILFLFFLNLTFINLSFNYIKNFKTYLNILLRLETKNFFNYNSDSVYQVINYSTSGYQNVDVTKLNSQLSNYWYYYYWLNINWNRNFLYLNVY